MENFDLTFLLESAVNGIPILFIILALVEFAKRLKKSDGTQAIQGNGLLFLSLTIGVFFGTGYMILTTRPPSGADWYPIFVYWFSVFIYGLALGLIAAGIYDIQKNIIQRQSEKQLAVLGYDRSRGEG